MQIYKKVRDPYGARRLERMSSDLERQEAITAYALMMSGIEITSDEVVQDGTRD